jgi:hypothetical protein
MILLGSSFLLDIGSDMAIVSTNPGWLQTWASNERVHYNHCVFQVSDQHRSDPHLSLQNIHSGD